MGKLVLGSLLAAVAMFIWGFLFYGTGVADSMVHHDADGAKARACLAEAFPSSGAYYVPDPKGAGASSADWMAQHQEGPLATVFVRREGANPTSVFLPGFLHMLVSALLIASLLRLALPALATYGSKVGFVAFAGLAGTVWGHLGNPIWAFQSWTYHGMASFYDVVAWTIAGAVLAKFVRR